MPYIKLTVMGRDSTIDPQEQRYRIHPEHFPGVCSDVQDVVLNALLSAPYLSHRPRRIGNAFFGFDWHVDADASTVLSALESLVDCGAVELIFSGAATVAAKGPRLAVPMH